MPSFFAQFFGAPPFRYAYACLLWRFCLLIHHFGRCWHRGASSLSTELLAKPTGNRPTAADSRAAAGAPEKLKLFQIDGRMMPVRRAGRQMQRPAASTPALLPLRPESRRDGYAGAVPASANPPCVVQEPTMLQPFRQGAERDDLRFDQNVDAEPGDERQTGRHKQFQP